MNFDSFLSSPRWEILQIIAKKPSSPVEIADKLKTTVSYISQQLKLLDAAGLVTRKRTGASEKGKPRTLFTISNELLYIISLTNEFSGKRLISITNYHKTILKIWMLENTDLHYYIEKLFWKLEEHLQEIEAIFIETLEPKILVVSESSKLKQKIELFVGKLEKKLNCLFLSKMQLKRFSPESLISLHDPQDILNGLKGGNKNEV